MALVLVGGLYAGVVTSIAHTVDWMVAIFIGTILFVYKMRLKVMSGNVEKNFSVQ